LFSLQDIYPVRNKQENKHAGKNTIISKQVNDLDEKHRLNCSALWENAVKVKPGYKEQRLKKNRFQI
jgi:hypothetical protein